MLQMTEDGNSWYHVCSAALIRNNKALTAGQCVPSDENDAPFYRILGGGRFNIGGDGDAEQISYIQSFTRHPDFKQLSPSRFAADLAVITLTTKMDMSNPNIQMVTMAQDTDGDFDGSIGDIVGWENSME